MEKLYILIVDDQREVLTTVSRDLESLTQEAIVEECESPDEALELMEEIDSEGDFVAVIISDQVMPVKTGVEFLVEVGKDDRFRNTKKVLLTGLATHDDTINAINQASIHRYIEKPWERSELIAISKALLTEFILDKGLEYKNYKSIIDNDVLLKRLSKEV